MERKKRIAAVCAACFAMALVDAVIRPGYAVKSVIKALLFFLVPWLLCFRGNYTEVRRLFARKKTGPWPLLLGVAVYGFLLAASAAAGRFFDFSHVTEALQNDLGVHAGNFIFVSLYISLINSLLEEFFFRGFAFLGLKGCASRGVAHLFSAGAFALYHVAMLVGWFDWRLLVLSIAGLLAAGLLFNRLDERSGTLWFSWLVHMFDNFAINTVGFRLLRMI